MPLKTPNVIVIDDDDAVRRSLAFALEQEGLRVRTFADGAEALAAGELPPDACLVVDFYMPGENGIALVAHLRARNPDLAAILITAKPSEEIREAAALAGITHVLEKPLDDGSLLAEIRAMLHLAPKTAPVADPVPG